MQVRPTSLHAQLKKGLASSYLLSGDEPLQMGEAADAIRTAARADGFESRDVIEVDRSFNWDELAAEANNLSLFSERRIIDLRIPSGKPGIPGGKALLEYLQRPPEDTLLLITMPKLEPSQTKSKWFMALDSAGVVVRAWPIKGEELPRWIEQRMQQHGLQPEPGVAAMLAERIEGNLLAATQEIEKLLLLHGPATISTQQLTAAVADSSRFNVFDLADSALAGDSKRCLRIISGLDAEGAAAPLVLWALSRDLRMLVELTYQIKQGRSPQQAVAARHDIWQQRKQLVTSALQRRANWKRLLLLCGQADRAIKGRSYHNPWLLFKEIATGMCGINPLPSLKVSHYG